MGEGPVRCDVESGVATITLDSPIDRNALSTALLSGLVDALDRAEQPDVRVIVVTHTDPAFCSGADLNASRQGPPDSNPFIRVIERLIGARQPTIAAVRGPVRAGGVGLMASCDLAVVQSDVTFAFTEVRIGVAPAIISVPVLRRCPWSKVAGPFLTGETFTAAAALEMGLVTHVADNIDEPVRALLNGVLAAAPGAVAATKSLLHYSASKTLRHDLNEMRVVSERLFGGTEAVEGIAAFIERRKPNWVEEI